MKRIILMGTVMLAAFVLLRCEKGTDLENGKTLEYLKTELGGCHSQDFDALKSAGAEGNDTLILTVKNDTLEVFVGLNYICCAPFISDIRVTADTVVMNLTDDCDFPDESCYCRCMCFYTWNFVFTGFVEKEYYYKVVLNNPQVDFPVVFSEGRFKP